MLKLSVEQKRTLREYFKIKNITVSKRQQGYENVNEYYDYLLQKYDELEKQNLKSQLQEKQKQKEEENRLWNEKLEFYRKIKEQREKQRQQEEKRKLRNKLKKLKRRNKLKNFVINIQCNITEEEETTDEETENETVECPDVMFLRGENEDIRRMLNMFFDTNDNYRNFLQSNKYTKVLITMLRHRGFTDEEHFNGYFLKDNDEKSCCIHFYTDDTKIIKLSYIQYIS